MENGVDENAIFVNVSSAQATVSFDHTVSLYPFLLSVPGVVFGLLV